MSGAPSQATIITCESVSDLLSRLELDRYIPTFEDEAIDDVKLLHSMGSMLAGNLRELGLDQAAIDCLVGELKMAASSWTVQQVPLPAAQTALPQAPPPSRMNPPAGRHLTPRAPRLASVYINLAARKDRRAAMEAVLHGAGLARAERVEAITGVEVPLTVVGATWDTTLNARFDRNCQPVPALDMSVGERGCAASHIALWKRCVASDAPLLVSSAMSIAARVASSDEPLMTSDDL